LGEKAQGKKQKPLNQTRPKDDNLQEKKLHLELPSSFSLPPFTNFYLHSIRKKLKKILTKKTTISTICIWNCHQALTSHDFAKTHLHPKC
jgi:hypothetical protein